VLFSEPKIPQSYVVVRASLLSAAFQCSSASRKFLNGAERTEDADKRAVSVLFSEPKIPQYQRTPSSTYNLTMFQCSSASRKFLNSLISRSGASKTATFQCSSASRKFLNRRRGETVR